MKKLIALALALVLAASAFCIQAFAYRAATGVYQGYEWEGRFSISGNKKSAYSSMEYEGYKNVTALCHVSVYDKSGHPIMEDEKEDTGYRSAYISYFLTGKYANFIIRSGYGTFRINGGTVGGC